LAVNEEYKRLIAEIIKETIVTVRQHNTEQYDKSYFQKTEKLLYNYPALKESIQQKEEELKYLDESGLPATSKSVITLSSRSTNTESDRYMELKESYQRSKERTEWLIGRIDNALDTIRTDKYFFIIEEKYFKKTTNEKILEIMDLKQYNGTDIGISERTILRNKNRLIEKIVITLFGAGALEDICAEII